MEILAMIGSGLFYLVIIALVIALAVGAIFLLWWVFSSALAWWVANPPKDPVYDSSVRYRASKAPQIIAGVIALTFVVLNVAHIVGGPFN